MSFGQGLYFCLGAYTVGLIGTWLKLHDALLLTLLGGALAGALALVLGFLLARYRDIFFAMLSLAFSMILYGLLAKVTALGSTDGFNVEGITYFGQALSGAEASRAQFSLTCYVAIAAVVLLKLYLDTPLGRLAHPIRDNEIRVEYLGASVRAAIHVKYVIAAALAGLGGALTAVVVGHVDPEFTYWTTSGEFVFVSVLAGSGNVVAPFVGSFVFEVIRSFAYEHSPNTWQLTLGLAMLAIIAFLPGGLWSLFTGRRSHD